MIYKVIDHPEWDYGRFRITIADKEIRVKYNQAITDGNIVHDIAMLSNLIKKGMSIAVTVRSWDENIQEVHPIRFYTLVSGKKTTLFSVKREV